MSKKNYKVDSRSTSETFEQWLNECGHRRWGEYKAPEKHYID